MSEVLLLLLYLAMLIVACYVVGIACYIMGLDWRWMFFVAFCAVVFERVFGYALSCYPTLIWAHAAWPYVKWCFRLLWIGLMVYGSRRREERLANAER